MLRIRLLVTLSLFAAGVFSADHPHARQCGTHPVPATLRVANGNGGIYLPSTGVLRILLVFASFPDDTTSHAYWPARQAPLFMNSFVDPDTATRSTDAFNLTNYFRQMSLGTLHVIGDAVWVESTHSQEEYRASGSYGAANMAILPESVDPLVDFSRYDNWTRTGNYTHVNAPDTIVDMVIMVWRTTMWGYLGEASLGYKPAIPADGKRIAMGYPAYYPMPVGSGVTCEYPYGDAPVRVMRTMVHEMSHWLLGIFHPYNGSKPDGKFQYWGMLCNGERMSGCANTYDRESLGWIIPRVVEAPSTVTLGDFITTGDAAKLHPPAGEPDEYIYLENHQGISVFDDVTIEPGDRGVWLLHQQGPYIELDNCRILPSDGLWQWRAAGAPAPCFGTTVPVFTRGTPDIFHGSSHRDQIATPSSLVNWMLAYRSGPGDVTCGPHFAGEGFRGAFDTAGTRVFSPCSNPAALTWAGAPAGFALEVTGQSGTTATVAISTDPLAIAPAKRHLGVPPGIARGPVLSLAWGTQWATGPPLETDVVWSELQRRAGPGETWTPIYAGPAFTCSDSSVIYDTTGTIPVRFRVRVRDAHGRSSAWSEEHVSMATSMTRVIDAAVPETKALLCNYPNPFNPATAIEFAVPTAGWSRVEVTDVLGRIVRELHNAYTRAGRHLLQWDGRDDRGVTVAGGVYFCRLSAGPMVLTRAMLFVK